MKSVIFSIIALMTTVLMVSCASQPQPSEPDVRNDTRAPIRKREADTVLPMFTGHYEITDSRQSRWQIAFADLSIESGVPTMRLSSENGRLIMMLKANECAGDIVNPHTQHMYLVCFGPSPAPYGNIPHHFSFSKVPSDYVYKSGTLIPEYTPMPVTGGYVITFGLTERFAHNFPLAARRVGSP